MEEYFLYPFFLLGSILSSIVGHGGASTYLAVMAIAGVDPVTMKITALFLNIVVSLVAFSRFYSVKAFSWRIFLPLVLTSMPMAFFGGTLTLPNIIYKPFIGCFLIYAAIHSLVVSFRMDTMSIAMPNSYILMILGGFLGIISGLTGIGGGIFLSPILIFMGWATPRTTSGIASSFIFVNSVAGLIGALKTNSIPNLTLNLMPIVLVGAMIGSVYGSKFAENKTIRRFLSIVLLIAGSKMIFTY